MALFYNLLVQDHITAGFYAHSLMFLFVDVERGRSIPLSIFCLFIWVHRSMRLSVFIRFGSNCTLRFHIAHRRLPDTTDEI